MILHSSCRRNTLFCISHPSESIYILFVEQDQDGLTLYNSLGKLFTVAYEARVKNDLDDVEEGYQGETRVVLPRMAAVVSSTALLGSSPLCRQITRKSSTGALYTPLAKILYQHRPTR